VNPVDRAEPDAGVIVRPLSETGVPLRVRTMSEVVNDDDTMGSENLTSTDLMGEAELAMGPTLLTVGLIVLTLTTKNGMVGVDWLVVRFCNTRPILSVPVPAGTLTAPANATVSRSVVGLKLT